MADSRGRFGWLRDVAPQGEADMQRRAFVKGLTAVVGGGALAEASKLSGEGFESLVQELKSLTDEATFWSRIRKEFLLNPQFVHLNTGSLGATPRKVLAAVSGWLYEIEGDPVSNVWGSIGNRMEEVRARAAEFLGASLDEVALTENTTSGMNAVALAIAGMMKPGDEVLTTNHEHPGGAVCWDYLVKNHGVKIVTINMPAPARDQEQILQLVREHLTPRTRVCSFSHVETITGLRMPLAEISKLTRPREILLVCDGAQAPGMLQIDVKKLGVDTYASSSHKWMLAPKGCGLLYIRKEAQDRVKPLVLSTGFNAYTAASGTRNVAQILGHGMAMDFHNAIGRDRVEARCLALANHLRRRFAEIPALRPLSPDVQELNSGIVTYGIKGLSHETIYKRLHAEHDILVKVVPKPEYNALRFSTHIYNREEDLDRTAELLRAMARS